MPKQFEANVLNQLANIEEIEIETRSATGRTHRTIIWVMVNDNEVYVRSVRARNGRWYQEITANPDAAIHLDRQRLAVHAVPVTDEALIARVSNEIFRKYGDGPSAHNLVREKTLPTTLQLEPAYTKLRAALSGHLIEPGDSAYDQARRVWNGMVDRRPAAIARCATVTDVVTCVEFARTCDMTVAIRGGGHNVAANAVCDGGLVIDLSLMREIVVDAPRRRVRAEACCGANWTKLPSGMDWLRPEASCRRPGSRGSRWVEDSAT